eukprot:5544795-Amphidinium_carterae.1
MRRPLGHLCPERINLLLQSSYLHGLQIDKAFTCLQNGERMSEQKHPDDDVEWASTMECSFS